MKSPLEIRNPKLAALLSLARPANVVTAWADVAAGLAVSGLLGAAAAKPAAALLLATSGLYAGGVVFNDVFDAELDAVERPERPIPSGLVSRAGASFFGGVLLAIGVGSAWVAGSAAGVLAIAIAVAALVYDRFGKHHGLFGPLNMGLCRGLNLLLGVSAVPAVLSSYWFLAFLPIAYIAAITFISRDEVHGGSKKRGGIALALVVLVTCAILVLAAYLRSNLIPAILFTGLFGWFVIPAFARASRQPDPDNIKRAVRAGVLGLIPLNAALASAFASWPIGIIILLLLPISIGLARLFAVT